MNDGFSGRFAIANPDVAPYGKAAEAVLRQRGLWNALRPQLVLGDTIAQAAQFASTGNAVGGLVAYSLVFAPGFADRGAYTLIPATDHPPLRQRMVVLKRATEVAVRFYDYVQTDRRAQSWRSTATEDLSSGVDDPRSRARLRRWAGVSFGSRVVEMDVLAPSFVAHLTCGATARTAKICQ